MEIDTAGSDTTNTVSSACATEKGNSTETEMIDYLVKENQAFFRSQQINDPDITDDEKKVIVQQILNENHRKFLFRFGNHIKEEHLSYFEQQKYENADDNYEIHFLIKEIRRKIVHKEKNIKNRRYAALQQMIKENSYFSEKEMMSREPLLYDQLVGQYMTETERKIRDNFNENEMEFSDILMEGICKNHVNELRKKQEMDEAEDELCECIEDTNLSDRTDSQNGALTDTMYPQIPPSYKQHWGDFEDEPSTIEGTKRLDSKQNYITAEEKELLKEEFYGIMYSNFISGHDRDFDYKTVDDNPDYDNLEQQNRDAEDKYFAEDDNDDDYDDVEEEKEEMENHHNNGILENSIQSAHSNSSEDELDVYMKQFSDENNKT